MTTPYFDDLGLCAILRNALDQHTRTMRGTGRTTRQIYALQPGDVFVTTRQDERDLRRKVESAFGAGVVTVVGTGTTDHDLHRIFDAMRGDVGRIVLEHHFAEKLAEQHIAALFRDVEGMNRELHERREARKANRKGGFL